MNKSGRVFDDLSYIIKKKGLAPFIRDVNFKGLEVKKALFNQSCVESSSQQNPIMIYMLCKGVTGSTPKNFFH